MLNKFQLSLFYYICKIYFATCRFKIDGEKYLTDAKKEGRNVLFALWHCHMPPLIYYHRQKNITTIVSESKDGEIGTYLLKRFGYQPVRGSSSRGGVKAVIQAKKIISQGYDAAVTLDGPKGPRFKAKPGTAYLAKVTGTPLLPILFSCKKYKQLNSWDKMVIPLPFTEITIHYAPLIFLNSDRSEESIKSDTQMLEKKMMELTFAHSKNHCKDII